MYGSWISSIHYRAIIWLQGWILWNSLRSPSFDSHYVSTARAIQPFGAWLVFIYWNKCWTNWSITNPIWLSCITEIILPSKITNPSYDDGRIGVLTEKRRWTVNLISCINKVSDQWKMLVNIQGKGRALDEKSERLLIEYNMSLDPEGKIDRRLLLTVSLRISKSLWVWCGIRLKHDGGHASGWGIFSSACPAPEIVLIRSLSHYVRKMCSSLLEPYQI